jgi:hypothetical protein
MLSPCFRPTRVWCCAKANLTLWRKIGLSISQRLRRLKRLNHGLELENDHPPRDAGNVQPELVCNVPPQTRTRTRSASYRYPSPEFPSDFEDGSLLYDSYGVPMRTEEDLGDSSNQATATSKDKPISRKVICTPRTATSSAPKDGTTAPPKGKASGGR